MASIFRNLLELRVIPQIIRSLLFNRAILIFQMGKVGSTSVLKSIKRSLQEQEGEYRSKYTLVHEHRIFLADFYLARGFYKFITVWRAWLGLPIKIVCPIREPIARDVSGFFFMNARSFVNSDLEEMKEWFLTASKPGSKPKHRTEIGFRPKYIRNWFDEQFKPLTHIDVYKKPFPIDRKWQTYKRGFTQVLLYRSDLERSEQAKLVSRFLGIKLDEIKLQNTSRDMGYAKHYSQFRESVKLPEEYIRRMHDSRFAQHFWSPQELKKAADKWRATSSS